MSQVSYGTITITDTNDIERIYIEYCRSTSNQLDTSVNPPVVPNITVAWGEKTPSWVNGQYIWQRSVIKKTGSTNLTYGTPVCLTGAVGATGAAGRGLTATVTKYCNYGTGEPAANYSGWVDAPPSYDSSKPNYWVKITNTYSAAPTSENIIYKDEALTKAVTDAAIANSIAQQTIEDSQGAMSQANNGIKEIYRVWYRTNSSSTPDKPSTHVTETRNDVNNTWTKVKPIENSNYRYYFYCEETITNGGVSSWTNPVLDITTLSKYEVEALDSRTKTFFFPGDSSYPGAYVVGKNSDDGLKQDDISTYGFNTRVTTTGISIGYNEAKVLHLKTTPSPASLDFYKPPTISGNTVEEGELAASLSATGLILSKGGVKAGTPNQSGFIYLSTEPYGSYSVNGSSGISDWKEIIGTKFGVRADGTLYANNAVINGSITLGTGSKIGTTDAATVVTNASTGAGAASDLATYKETVSDTYATKDALSEVEGQIPDISGLASKTESIKSVTTETQYRLSNSSTSLTGSGTGYSWSTTIPTWVNNTYLWTRIATTYTPVSGSATTVYKPGTEINQWGIYDSQLTIALSTASAANTKADGAASTVTTTQEYRLSNSSTSLTGSGTGYTWSSTIPTWVNNTYLWTRFKIEKASVGGTTTTTYTPGSSDKEYGIYDSALTIALSTASSAKSTAEAAAPKSSAIAEEQLIYIQATSGTNSVSAYPSSSTTTSSYWVTQTGESIPNGTPPDSATEQTPIWTTKRPSYQKNYPVIFVAKQKKTVSGTITCTTPIKDDTTTIIDGGHITTGIIDASKITVTNLQASSIAVGSSNVAAALDTKASNSAEYEVVVKVNSINYTTPSATLIAIPTKLGASTTGSFVWYKNAIGTAHGGTVSTTTNTNDTLTVTDLNALYIAVLQ